MKSPRCLISNATVEPRPSGRGFSGPAARKPRPYGRGVILARMLAVSAVAQVTTATFYGIVTDSTGAVAPGATVTLTNEGTSATLTRTSDQNGEFGFDFLPVGTYILRIEAKGFKK